MFNSSYKTSDGVLLTTSGISLILCLFFGYLTIDRQLQTLPDASSNFVVYPLILALLVLVFIAAMGLSILIFSPLPLVLGMAAGFTLAFANRRSIAEEHIVLIPWENYAYGVLCALLLIVSFVAVALYKNRSMERESDELMLKTIEELAARKANT